MDILETKQPRLKARPQVLQLIEIVHEKIESHEISAVDIALADLRGFAPFCSREIFLLRSLAESLEEKYPLTLFPKWKFAALEKNVEDIRLQCRFKLWKFFNVDKQLNPIKFKWYSELEVYLYLSNDLSRCLYVSTAFEPNEFVLLDYLLLPGMTFLDIGANEGLYTVFAASKVGKGGAVHAFEPSERERHKLKSNVALNKLENVTIHDCALSDRVESMVLNVAEDRHAGINSLGSIPQGVRTKEQLQVYSNTLDNIATTIALQNIDFIKVDIEGAETSFLRGGEHTISTFKPGFIIELNNEALSSQGTSVAELFSLLKKHGYQSFVFSFETGALTPLNSEKIDGVNIVALHPESQLYNKVNEILNGE